MALTALLCAGTGPGSSSDPRRACGPHRRLNGAVVCAGCLRCDIGGITRVPDAPTATLGALRGFRGADAPNATRALRGIPRVVQSHRRFMGIPRVLAARWWCPTLRTPLSGHPQWLCVPDARDVTLGALRRFCGCSPLHFRGIVTSIRGRAAPNATSGAYPGVSGMPGKPRRGPSDAPNATLGA